MANRLQHILTERYAQQYAQVNATIVPSEIRKAALQTMQLMYGEFVASLPSGSKVLDVGCGSGILLQWLSKQSGIVPIGIDCSPTQIQAAKRGLPPEIELTCVDGLAYLQNYVEAFDGIFCMDVLEHLPDEDTCLAWIESALQALRSNGFFICRAPNAANLTASYSRYMDLTHQRMFTRTSLLQLLEAGGLRDCRVIPVQAGHLTGRVRLKGEHILHKLIFLVCGRGLESVFTSNVCMIGVKKEL